jgi:hypothetical protein
MQCTSVHLLYTVLCFSRKVKLIDGSVIIFTFFGKLSYPKGLLILIGKIHFIVALNDVYFIFSCLYHFHICIFYLIRFAVFPIFLLFYKNSLKTNIKLSCRHLLHMMQTFCDWPFNFVQGVFPAWSLGFLCIQS